MINERVLIVTGSPEDAEFLSETVLHPQNYQVYVADNDETGLTLARRHAPHIILLDADAFGLTLLTTLREQGVNIPTVITMSETAQMPATPAFKAGVKDCLVKPYTSAEMLKAVDYALTETRLRDEQEQLKQRFADANRSLEQRFKELNTLFGIGKSVTSWLDPDKLLPRLVEAAIYLTSAEAGSLLLIDEATDEFYMVASRGLDDRIARSFRLPVAGSLAGDVMLTGQPLILTEDEAGESNTGYPVKSLIYVPLKIKEQVTGILSVDNRYQSRNFTNNNLRMLSALADYVAVLLEMARLSNRAEAVQSQLSAVLSRLEEPVAIISDQNDEIIEANPVFCRLFKVEENDVRGQPFAVFTERNHLFDFLPAVLDAGNSQNSEVILNDGRIFQISVIPVFNVGRAIIMQDITYVKKIEQMKSEFVSTISQDIRAPLNSIKEYADMLNLAGELNDKQQRFANRIVAGVEQITTLVDNLLDLSTIEAGIDAEKTIVDIGKLTTQVVSGFQNQAGQKRQQFVGHITGEPAPVVGNVKRLRQVITHLIDNAIKHTPEEGQISTIVQTENNQVIFKIEDSGSGIPPADLPFIFDKFFRVKDNAQMQGNGLGLALCKSIIESYSGRIWVENRAEQGCIFTFSLPLTPLVEAVSTPLLDIEPLAA